MPAKYGVAVSGLFATFVISVILEAAAVIVGLRGSIFEQSRRKPLPYIIYANFASHIGQLGFNCEFLLENLTQNRIYMFSLIK